MTNQEKFKTPEERIAAFDAWCNRQSRKVGCGSCPIRGYGEIYRECLAYWLALEAEEKKPEPCPFCGGETHSNLGHLKVGVVHYWVDCISPDCMYRSAHYTDKNTAIAAHNRICHAVKAAKEGEHRLKRAETCINKCYSNITNRAIDPGSACLNIATLIREYRGLNAQTKESEVTK